MTDLDEQLRSHQYFYVPWVDEKPLFNMAAPLALRIRELYNARLTVVCPVKSNAPDDLAKYLTVTERSGTVPDGGVVLVYCPTQKLMAKVDRLRQSIVIVVEWASESHAGWAKLVGAFNLVTQATMGFGLSSEAEERLKELVFAGYNGWRDSIAERQTVRVLEELERAGEYDQDLVLAYSRRERGERGIERLYPLLERFEGERSLRQAGDSGDV